MLLNVPQPLGNVVKRLCVGDIIDQHNAHRAAVVGRRDGVEPFLSGSVPNLKENLLKCIFLIEQPHLTLWYWLTR